MDCDARRKVLFTDIDGKLFGKPGTTVISKSEFGWDGDRKWGLGKMRGNSCIGSKDKIDLFFKSISALNSNSFEMTFRKLPDSKSNVNPDGWFTD